MATASLQQERRIQRVGYPAYHRGLDTLMGLLAFILIFGLFIDGWAHNHGKVDESFFTIYHAMMYSSYALFGFTLLGLQVYNVNRGYSFWKALPQGYLTSLIGVFIFGAGGIGDLVWHEVFGIEDGVEALVSPSHLALALGYAVVLSGVIQSAWSRRETQHTWKKLGFGIVAWASFLSLLLFFLQFAYYFSDAGDLVGRPVLKEVWSSMGVFQFMISTACFSAIALIMLRRWRLPFGTLTFVFTFAASLMAWMLIDVDDLNATGILAFLAIAPALGTGLLADILSFYLKASPQRPMSFRIIGTIMGFVLALGYMGSIHAFGILSEGRGLWWTVHMWLGIPTVTAFMGLLLSYLVLPPAIPDESGN